jgi:TupA-like ATPgrasp
VAALRDDLQDMSRVARFIAGARAEGFFRAAEKRIAPRLMRMWPFGDFWDRHYAFMKFRLKHGRSPDVSAPMLNDQLYKLKTNGELENPLRVFVTDKEFVKLFVKAMAGDEFNVPTIAVLRNPSEARSFVFPDRCCIKPTHGSGQTIIRKHGEAIDIDKIVSWFGYCHYYRKSRERNYLRLTPKIIVEQLAFDADNAEDYKFYCFHGEPKFIQVNLDVHTNWTCKIYDRDWKDTGCSLGHPMSSRDVPRPANLDYMLALARILSRPFSFLRVDLYTNGESILVGELTNCPGGGGGQRFIPPAAEAAISAICFAEIMHP